MGNRIGNGYIGTDSLKTSTANLQIIPNPPSNFSLGTKYNLYKFAFMNDQDCTVIVNGGNTLFLRAGQGFEINESDLPINSFVIIEAGITYNWIGGI
jgi:hypothetical protein